MYKCRMEGAMKMGRVINYRVLRESVLHQNTELQALQKEIFYLKTVISNYISTPGTSSANRNYFKTKHMPILEAMNNGLNSMIKDNIEHVRLLDVHLGGHDAGESLRNQTH